MFYIAGILEFYIGKKHSTQEGGDRLTASEWTGERTNRELGPIISKLINTDEKEQWYKVLPDVEFAIYNMVHKSINKYPRRMLFGLRQKEKAIDTLKENVLDLEQIDKNINLQNIKKKAEETQKRAQDYDKKYFEAKRREPHIYRV